MISAIIPVALAYFIWNLMNADLLGGVTELRGKEFYEDLDIY